MRLQATVPLVVLILVLLCPLGWLLAGLPEYSATEIAIGSDPIAVAVTHDDRIVATLLDTDAPTVSWVDTADFSEGPFTIGISGAGASSLEAAELEGEPAIFVGGSQLDVLRWDDSTVPAGTPALDSPTGLGASGGLLVALEWDTEREALYGGDATHSSLRHVDYSTGVPVVDSPEGWPIDLGFTPTDLQLFDDGTLLVVGQAVGAARAAAVDLATASVEELDVSFADGIPVAVAVDGTSLAWLYFSSGEIWELEGSTASGDDDDSAAGDDDDSAAGDDDDSAAGDDDDSAAGDDDDSAAGDDDDATEPTLEWTFTFFIFEASVPGIDLVYREVDGEGYLYVAGGNAVQLCDLNRILIASFPISSQVSSLTASSGEDGFIYASVQGTEQLAIISSGPWIEVDSVLPVSLLESTDEMTVAFTAYFGEQTTDVCDYHLAIDADITGGGTVIEDVDGQAVHGSEVELTLTGAQLLAGEHRIFIFCEDDEGDLGRASFAYDFAGLDAPTGFAVDPDDGNVVASWDDDGLADTFVLYFDSVDFSDDEEPSWCNADESMCSPYIVVPDRGAGDDDDDSAASYAPLEVDVTGLTNGTTYYFAVAARDPAAYEGPRAGTLSATPSLRGGAAALAGDLEGCSCQNSLQSSAQASAVGSLLLLGALRLRRRRATRTEQ